jgi:hypothetical protein
MENNSEVKDDEIVSSARVLLLFIGVPVLLFLVCYACFNYFVDTPKTVDPAAIAHEETERNLRELRAERQERERQERLGNYTEGKTTESSQIQTTESVENARRKNAEIQAELLAKARAAAPTPTPTTAWEYEEDTDTMTQKTTRFARVKSSNTAYIAFPMGKSQHAILTLRKHPRYGKDVILRIQEGMFNCNPVEGCSVRIRFDNGKMQTFSASMSENMNTEMLFIQNYPRFVAAIKKAKVAYIEASFYMDGNKVFEFPVSGLEWK